MVRVYRLDVPGPWGSVGSTRSIGPWGSFGPWGSIGPWSTRGPWSGILPAIWIETPANDIRIRVEFRGGGKTATREAAAHHVASMRVEEHVLGLKLRIPIQAGAKEYVDVDYVESEVVVRIQGRADGEGLDEARPGLGSVRRLSIERAWSDRGLHRYSLPGRLARRLLSEADGVRFSAPASDFPRREERLGLHEADLASLAVRCRFGRLAEHFRSEGGPAELREIAWWGSALADIATEAAAHPRNDDLLTDAAFFNLGVALFDGVVDNAPARIPAIAKSLSPTRLRRKLARPLDPEAALSCAEPDFELIVSLFDQTLGGVGQRCADAPPGVTTSLERWTTCTQANSA